jgi:hypothetical protein
MKLAKIGFAVAALALVLSFRSESAWATRVIADIVTGEITAVPYGGKIEVDHHSYTIKAGSPAEQVSHGIYVGDVVDLVFDSSPTESTAAVIIISKHSGSK